MPNRYNTMPKFMYLLLFFILCKTATAQLTYQNLYVDYDSAWTYKNLKVIPIRFKGFAGSARVYPGVVSLSQAMQEGWVKVSERGTASTENVHWLRINNSSGKSVYIGSGEMILGGRQDRMVARDTILEPSGSDQYISVMCVEEGRWSDKQKKFLFNNYANPVLRKVLDHSKNQVLIWKEILSQLSYNGIRAPTLAYASQRADKKFTAEQEAYLKYFVEKFRNADSTITGIVCMSNDKVIGMDVFIANNLFYGELLPLLHGYIEEALIFGHTPVIENQQVKAYLDPILTNEQSQEAYLKTNGKIFKNRDKVIHITGYAQ